MLKEQEAFEMLLTWYQKKLQLQPLTSSVFSFILTLLSLYFFTFFKFSFWLLFLHSEIWNHMINQYSYAVKLIPVGNLTISIFFAVQIFWCTELLLQLKRILQENKNRSTASIKLLNDENSALFLSASFFLYRFFCCCDFYEPFWMSHTLFCRAITISWQLKS